MPFASINPTNPRTNPWNFHKKFWELPILKNSHFEKSTILDFFFISKEIFFCLIPMKISHKLCIRMDGTDTDLLFSLVYSKYILRHILVWFSNCSQISSAHLKKKLKVTVAVLSIIAFTLVTKLKVNDNNRIDWHTKFPMVHSIQFEKIQVKRKH